ncbi:MAG: serpin family protein [Salinivirgaceae bacterium]|nr:serpin family protein [Salinivirgaceae bacterium]
MKKKSVFAALIIAGFVFAACDKNDNTEPEPQPEPTADTTSISGTTQPGPDPDSIPPFWCEIPVYQNDTVSVNLGTISAQTEGDFTFNIVKQLNNESDGNFFLSPISVQMAFAMLANGADGDSRKQIIDAFGYGSKSIDELNGYCRKIISDWNTLNSEYANKSAQVSEYENGASQQTIETANAIWTDRRFPLFSEYIELCNNYFDAEAATLNFANKDSSLAVMNGWCNQKTHGMIPSMLSDLDPLTITVMANALYFKADWANPFKEYATQKADFTNADGAVSQVDMMHQQEYFNYVRTDIFTMAELPYTGTTCMDIILPNNGISVGQCIEQLSQVRFDAALAKMSSQELFVHLPKFDLEFNHNLVKIMNQLGVVDVFSPLTADLSKMGGGYTEAFVSDAFQLSHISVDESGTEAAAVTVVVFEITGVVGPVEVPIEFNVNRPFAYIIRDKQTGAILFVGKVEKL